jgi:FkbM family methyltransferase
MHGDDMTEVEPQSADPFRNVKLHWHRLRKTSRITRDGITLNSDASVSSTVRNGLYKGGYEAAERMLLKRHLKPGQRVLEVGAGIGFVGLLATRIAGAGNVLSYEANPGLEPVIRANYALNSPVPDLRMRAVTTDGAPVVFHRSDNIVSSSIYDRPEASQRMEVQSDALEDVIAEFRPDLLILDVEGYEVDLLASPPDGPSKYLIELHPHVVGKDRIDAMLRKMQDAGLKVVDRRDSNVVLARR